MSKQIKLGNKVRCVISGFTGIASTRCLKLNGSYQIGIQPPCAEGATALPDCLAFDENQIEVLEEGVSNLMVVPTFTPSFKLGDEVKDSITGVVGIAVEQVTFLNGCVYIWIVPKKSVFTKNEEKTDWQFMEGSRLVRVGPGINAKKEEPQSTAEPKRATGGPNSKIPRI